TLRLERVDDDIGVTNPRVTIGFMVQEDIFQEIMDKRGRKFRKSGNLARYLFGWPTSTQGFRFVSLQEPIWLHLPKFHQRVTELLNAANDRWLAGDSSRIVLSFSPEAKERWVQVQNDVESHLHPSGSLASVRDFASKSMEITGRVAAIFHHFSGQEGTTISMETLERAISIVA